jgi:hypothetical protein
MMYLNLYWLQLLAQHILLAWKVDNTTAPKQLGYMLARWPIQLQKCYNM